MILWMLMLIRDLLEHEKRIVSLTLPSSYPGRIGRTDTVDVSWFQIRLSGD